MPPGMHTTSVLTGIAALLQFVGVVHKPLFAPLKVFVQAPTEEVIVVTSEAVLFAVFVSLPPDTVTVLVTEGGALPATVTVNVITGYDNPAPNASDRVQTSVLIEQVHPVPVIAVGVMLEGRESAKLTVPAVAPVPLLVTVIKYCAPLCPCEKFPLCDFVTVKSGTFVPLCGVSTKIARSACGVPPPQLAQAVWKPLTVAAGVVWPKKSAEGVRPSA